MELREAVSGWLSFKRHVRGCALTTCALYACYLGAFQRTAGARRDVETASGYAERFLEKLSRRGLSDAARQKAFFVLRAFFRYCRDLGYCQADPFQLARAPIVHDTPRYFPTREEVLRIMKYVRGAGRDNAARDYAIIAMMFYAGLRVGEVCRMRPEHVDLDAGTMRVHGKGGKVSDVPMHPELVHVLCGWLRERALHYRGSPYLFPSRSGNLQTFQACGRLDDSRVEKLLHEYAKSGGFRDITPHAIRRAFANELRALKVPLYHIQQLLRHTRIETTMRYLKGADVEELRDSVGRL